MWKKKGEVETKETPVRDLMLERKRLKEEVEKSVNEKIETILQDFHKRRDQEVDELIRLRQILEGLESKKATFAGEKDHLVTGIFGAGSKGVGDLDLKICSLEKEIKSCQGQVEKVFSRLVELPLLSFPFLNFLIKYEKSKP